MKTYKILIFLFLISFVCCKQKKSSEGIINKKEVPKSITKSNTDFTQEVTIDELKYFYKKLNNLCKSHTENISKILSKKVMKLYPNFCEMHKIISLQKEGEVQFEIDNGIGVITINSVEFIEGTDEKHRNEYSTFFYIIKNNNKLILNEIGGAG